jgi:hypothetical protein
MVYQKKYKPDDAKIGKCPRCLSTRLLHSKGKITCDNCGKEIGNTFNKFGAKKQAFKGNIYDSKLEANVAEHYDTMLNAGEFKEVLRQVKIPLQAYGTHIFNYFIDFILIHHDGHKEYVEAKGQETDLWKAKWKMLEGKLALEEPTSEMTLLKQGNMPRRRK